MKNTHLPVNFLFQRGQIVTMQDKSDKYWMSNVRAILERYPKVQVVEVVRTSRKSDSVLLPRGATSARPGEACIIASSGGKWGKSRRNYYPSDRA